MNLLLVGAHATVLKIFSRNGGEGNVLEEQAGPFLAQNPLLILEVGDIAFNSMEIGELVNLVRKFEETWGTRFHRIGLLNLSPRALEVFKTAKLDTLLDNYESVSDALARFEAAS